MAKRTRDEGDASKPLKRYRAENVGHAPGLTEIHSARQLQDLLTFRQDAVQQSREGIASFKFFLEKILYHKGEDDRGRELSILRDYLESQKPADPKSLEEKPFLAQLWQAWSFASQNNNDHLVSATAAILALLLRTLSSLLDLREHGILLCRTILQRQHLQLVQRSLDAPKHREFLISPALRLLTEVVSFDGGAMVNELYKRREQTFDINSLRRNLSLLKVDVPEEEARRKPAVRTLTVRFVLTCLKYLHVGGKADILRTRSLFVSLFHYLPEDPAELVSEILNATERHVLKDDEIPRSAKATMLVQHNLERVLQVATRSGNAHAAASTAFAWLKSVCTIPSYGVLRPGGWYPAGTVKLNDQHYDEFDGAIDLGLDSIEFYDRSHRPDVRNPTLLAWIQTLRPHVDATERELLLACFESAPELVAAYFAEKTIQMEPKLSNTWIGYASFLFEVIRLPVPSYLGNTDTDDYADLPPQVNIVLENILPTALSQKVLTRCLNQSSELITFFAIRILVLAFQKFGRMLKFMDEAALKATDNEQLWKEARRRLIATFAIRTPSMKDVVATFRKVSDDDKQIMQREAATRLLQSYYEILPAPALEELFDVSAALTTALAKVGDADANQDVRGFRMLELEQLLEIAHQSPGMKWFTRQGGLPCSPIVSLLRIHAKDLHNPQLRKLATYVLREGDIVADEREMHVLLASLLDFDDSDNEIWSFIDDCIGRVSRQPVKYVDLLDTAARKAHLPMSASEDVSVALSGHVDALPGLIIAVLVEQAPFVENKPVLAQWIRDYFALLGSLKPSTVLSNILQRQRPAALVERARPSETLRSLLDRVRATAEEQSEIGSGNAATRLSSLPFSTPQPESDDHPQLIRWAQKDLGVAMENGNIDALILCLCSQQLDVRRQALQQIRALFAKLQHTALEDKEQLRVIVGELVETYEQQCQPEDKPLPYLAGTFAGRALHIALEPTHLIYPKLNRYLIRSPEWRITRMPAHWFSSTAGSMPTEDDAYWREVQWMLDWLVEGLRTRLDLDILRRSGMLQKVMGLCCSPRAVRDKGVRDRVMELMFRATCVEDGSATLVTRGGALGWLDMIEEGDEVAKLMKARLLHTCGKERLQRWSRVSQRVE